MIYYYKDNKVYSSVIRLSDKSFTELTKEEYDERKNNAILGRVQGTVIKTEMDAYLEEEQWQI